MIKNLNCVRQGARYVLKTSSILTIHHPKCADISEYLQLQCTNVSRNSRGNINEADFILLNPPNKNIKMLFVYACIDISSSVVCLSYEPDEPGMPMDLLCIGEVTDRMVLLEHKSAQSNYIFKIKKQ